MHLLPRMNVMFDFSCIGTVELPGARNNLKLQNEKLDSSTRHARHPLIRVQSLIDLAGYRLL